MRRFFGYRPNPPADYAERGVAAPPNEPQYEGIVFTDGTVALRWRTDYKSTSVWMSYEDFYQVHGHPEYGTIIVWLDEKATDVQLVPVRTPVQRDPEAVAKAFHETYESLAPSFNYKTRKASATVWSEVPENNRKLMVAVAAELINRGVIA